MIIGDVPVNTAGQPVWMPLLVPRSDAWSAFGSQRRDFHCRFGEPA